MSFEQVTPTPSEKHNDVDLEGKGAPVVDIDSGEHFDESVVGGRLNHQANSRTNNLILNNTVFRVLNRFENRLNKKMDIEVEGIKRIPQDEGKPPSELNMALLWFSMNASITTFPTGMLGPIFGLDLGQSIGAVVLGTILGAMMTGFCASLSPKVSFSSTPVVTYTDSKTRLD